ncbi:hypothetical protein [Marisediminicola sp. LYQ134]|uniref:hypothetical protein n=1 Tax=Marisediminicola sp. LYQ134 TaxID=3391061 RepID=UPI003983917F
MIGGLGGVVDEGSPRCSRAGCSNDAEWQVNWRNPRIHGPERVKVWLACSEHDEWFREYLSGRDMPVQITRLGVTLDRVESV